MNDETFADIEPGTTILFPSPADIEAEIRQITGYETLTLTELRERLASKHDAEGTCRSCPASTFGPLRPESLGGESSGDLRIQILRLT